MEKSAPAEVAIAESSTPATDSAADAITTSPEGPAASVDKPATTAAAASPSTRAANPIPWDILLSNTFPAPNYASNADEDFVPAYTETDTSPILDLITSHPELPTLLALPLTTYPAPLHLTWYPPSTEPNPLASNDTLTDEEKAALYNLQVQIISTFFHAIRTKNSALVATLLSQGLVSPDTPSSTGQTPLLAAIEAGSGDMVCTLVNLGARVNAYGAVAAHALHGSTYPTYPAALPRAERTPLMFAAASGNLAMVKLLMESFSADDGIIAPDGQLALRLAADAGHRDVVAYLPARRGGAWRRWKVAHHVAWRRIVRASRKVYCFFRALLYEVPRFFLWSVPKHVVVKPLCKGCAYCWKNRGRFGGWCARQARALPGRVERAGRALWRGVKKAPGIAWRVAKAVPKALGRLLKRLWKVVQAIPRVMKGLCVWIWGALKKLGKATAEVFLRVLAALHTAVAAVLDFFRTIKLKDVWNGVVQVVDAAVRGLPKVIWNIVSGFGSVVAAVLIGLFGCGGRVVLLLIEALWYVAKYVPRQLGEIIAGIWSSIAKGYHEILVWINPKH